MTPCFYCDQVAEEKLWLSPIAGIKIYFCSDCFIQLDDLPFKLQYEDRLRTKFDGVTTIM